MFCFIFNCLSYISSGYLAHWFLHGRVCSHPILRSPFLALKVGPQSVAFPGSCIPSLPGSLWTLHWQSLQLSSTHQTKFQLLGNIPSRPTKADLKHFHLLVCPLAPTNAHQGSVWLVVPSTQPTSFPQASQSLPMLVPLPEVQFPIFNY